MTSCLKYIPLGGHRKELPGKCGIPRKAFEVIRKVLSVFYEIQTTKEATSWNKVNFSLQHLNLPEK